MTPVCSPTNCRLKHITQTRRETAAFTFDRSTGSANTETCKKKNTWKLLQWCKMWCQMNKSIGSDGAIKSCSRTLASVFMMNHDFYKLLSDAYQVRCVWRNSNVYMLTASCFFIARFPMFDVYKFQRNVWRIWRVLAVWHSGVMNF